MGAGPILALDRRDETFLETASRVSRAASRDESRPVLTGILVRFASGSVVMAATDSYRLSVKETAIGGESGNSFGRGALWSAVARTPLWLAAEPLALIPRVRAKNAPR